MSIIKKNKMVFAVFVLSIIGIVMSFISYRNSIKQIEMENFKESLREHTKIKLEITKDYISDMVYDLNTTAEAVQEYDSIWEPKVAEILSMANRMDMFAFTAVIDQDGNGYDVTGTKFNISEREYFKTAMQGTVAFSEVMPSKAMPGKDIQIFACPIWSEEHEVAGVVLGVLELGSLNKFIAHQSVQAEGNLYIIDSNGNYISRFQSGVGNSKYINFWEDLEDLSSMDKEISEIKSDFEQRKEGEFSFIDRGEHRLGCYMPIGTRNWQIVYTLKDASVDKTLQSIFRSDSKHAISVAVCYLIWLLCVVWYFRNANKEIKHAHQEVSKNMEILHIALAHSKHPIFEYDQTNRQLTLKTDFVSPLFQQTDQSVTPESIVESNIVVANSVEPFIQLFETIKTQKSAKADIQVHNGPEEVWRRISLLNIYKEKEIVGTVGFVEDITELKKVEQQSKRKLEIQEALIAKALLYVKADMDTDHLLEMNGEESEISFDEFLQKKVISHVRPEDRAYVAQELSMRTLQDKFQHGTDTVETQFMMDFDGTPKWVSCMEYCNPAKRSKLILIINDIDEKKRQEIALQHQAERDGLTELYNAATARVKIQEALTSGFVSDEKQAFILLDLDNYKLINDTFGHSCGDKVLVEVADVLRKRFRSSDIVGRLGGDEFVILLRNLRDYQHAEELINELCDKLHKPYEKDGEKVTLSASVGIAVVPTDGHTFAELYQKADKALYHVKKQTKNGYQYYNNLAE